LFVSCLSALAQDPFEGASWIRNPVFKDVPVINFLHREQVDPPELKGPQNVHTLFRKEITLKAAPKEAHLYITGDDYYKLYINGGFVVQGPEPGYPQAHPYYHLNLAGYLHEGTNVLASHSYYQGLRNRVWNSGDNRSGFLLALDVTYPDGTTDRFVTDGTWRYKPLEAFTGTETIGYDTQFAEDMDMRKWPMGWNRPGYDASDWPAPLVMEQDHRLTLQESPPLQCYRMDPVSVEKVRDGVYQYDFGKEIVGHTRVTIAGEDGRKIEVRHGEELAGTGRVRHAMRANCNYQEYVTLADGENDIAFYDYRAFRYIEIVDAPEKPEVWVLVRHHPFDDNAAVLSSEDADLVAIWNLCKQGVKMGSQGGFLDCPSREKGQYLGDAVITARSHLWLTGDPSLTRKATHDFALSRMIDPGLMAVAPGSFMQEIAEYSLQFPLLLKAYYENTGDDVYVRWMLEEVVPGIFTYFEGFAREDGLVAGLNKPEKWTLVDWPENLRDDYAYEYADKNDLPFAVLNAFYYGAHQAVADLSESVGLDAAPHREKAASIAKAFGAAFADSERGLYVDAPGSDHASLHANAIPLFFGLTEGADADAMLALIEEKGLACGVYIASYVIEACFKNDRPDLGYALLTNDSEHSWKEMLRAGATACMEAWGPDQKWNTSWCHPWSSSPIYLFARYVAGLQPGAADWDTARIAPGAIPELPAFHLVVPHRAGQMQVRYLPGRGYQVTLPPGVKAETVEPEGSTVTVRNEPSQAPAALPDHAAAILKEAGWNDRVGENLGVWIDVQNQMFYLIENNRAVWQARCGTATNGVGFAAGSNQTPTGWHHVSEKFGDDEPWGRVFRARKATSERWLPGDDVVEDLVLTRVLWLEGEKPGVNKGRNADGVNVDSKQRYIYIHGTNGEEVIGTPSSHGCIRLLNDDVITAYDQIPLETPVLITAD
jgi:hypothetical protein